MIIDNKKSVLFFTSANLACNPRCLKEVKLLMEMNVQVTVVAFHLHNWTTEIEKELNRELPNVKFYYLESTRKDFSPWLLSSLIEKIFRIISLLLPENIFCAAMALNKRSWLLLRWIKKSNTKPDLVIAHNPAAFYPAWRMAEKYKIPFAIDIEDYHPGEDAGDTVKKIAALLMKKLIPKTSYTSFASPLIKQYTENLVSLKRTASFVVNNLFPKSEFSEPVFTGTQNRKIRLIWFSQYIDYKRGLEKILPVLDTFQDAFELVLIGNVRQGFFTAEIKDRKYISCKESMPHKDLQKELSRYDIGLALEDGARELNRDICLTNKIWSYFQAGLFILATDTTAQKLFMKQYPQHGICSSLSKNDLVKTFKNLLSQKNMILSAQKERFSNASEHSWENESAALVKEWEEILQ